jgi:hypothetical protein
MRRFLRIAPLYPHYTLALAGLLGAAACSLTEAVRTMPGAPGEVGFENGGASPDAGAGGAGGLDAGGEDARADSSSNSGGAHQGGRGGTSGRSNTDGAAGEAGVRDGAPDAAPSCSVDVTFACHDYCNAMSLAPGCTNKLRASAGIGPLPPLDAAPPDGGHPEPDFRDMVEKCKCDCELRYRAGACRSHFDQLIMCGSAPLTVVCTNDPEYANEFPSVIGPCGSPRLLFVKCLDSSPVELDSGH